MPSISIHCRRLTFGILTSGLVLATAAGVHAQDGRGFFEQLFGAPAQPAPQPAYAAPDGAGGYDRARRRVRAEHRRRLRAEPQTRYAALPRPGADTNEIIGKQPVDQKAILENPTAAILKDETLRPGDIVMLPSGPRVFKGVPGKKHKISEFEDVKHSRLVDRGTRRTLLAMMVPHGAMTPEQARSLMKIRLKFAPQEELDTERTEATGPRVIAPWAGTR